MVVIVYNFDNIEIDGFFNIKKVMDEVLKKGYKVIGFLVLSIVEIERFVVN